MPYSCKIIEDSQNIWGHRLTTMQITFPRIVLAEFNTHRVFSRSSASSRAVPVEKIITQVLEDPVLPVWWGKNQSGMQAKEELIGEDLEKARFDWLFIREQAIIAANILLEDGLHKQIVNRLLEPWMWVTVVVSSTEWTNFFGLRCHLDAQPEIKFIADMMKESYLNNIPKTVTNCHKEYENSWHLPYITLEERKELDISTIKKVATARCARVSYLRQGEIRDIKADIKLHDSLIENGHWSPCEHVAMCCLNKDLKPSNFKGNWLQYRKEFDNDCR